jgi:hypothetical protein
MSRDIVTSPQTATLVVAAGVDGQLADRFAVLVDHSHVAVGDEEQDPFALVRPYGAVHAGDLSLNGRPAAAGVRLR